MLIHITRHRDTNNSFAEGSMTDTLLTLTTSLTISSTLISCSSIKLRFCYNAIRVKLLFIQLYNQGIDNI